MSNRVENPANTIAAFKRFRDITTGDFIVGFGYVVGTEQLPSIGGHDVHAVFNAEGKREWNAGSVEQLVRVPVGTPLTESLAIA